MPRPSSADLQSSEDLAACAAILGAGSKSFAAAARLLPRRVRGPATALYAFCREADDVIDDWHGPARLDGLRARLDRAYAGRPAPSAVDRAFSAAVLERRIPRAIPDALLEGFAWDADGRRYETIAELEAYAVRVAGTVGLMMAIVMGVRSEGALARALDLGVAMQLTNVARDIGEDARAGRLYLPRAWLAEAGIDPDSFLARPAYGPEIASVTRRLLDHAAGFYARGDLGIAALPIDCRPAISAARKIYAAIGDEIARAGFDSITRRAVVPRSAKLWRLVAATASTAALPHGRNPPPVEAGRPLLQAVVALEPQAPELVPQPFGERVGGVAEAFMRLQRRETSGGALEAG